MLDWIGKKYLYKGNWRSFKEARDYVRSLKLNSQKEYYALMKTDARPADIPYSPSTVYKEKWTSWGDWLGNDRTRTKEITPRRRRSS